jgi:hypothetical protein
MAETEHASLVRTERKRLRVALLDVAPEAVDRLGSGRAVGQAMAVGFLGFLVLSRLLILHHRDDPACAAGHQPVGALGALLGAAVPLSTHAYGLGLAAYAGIFLAIGVGEFPPRPTASRRSSGWR